MRHDISDLEVTVSMYFGVFDENDVSFIGFDFGEDFSLSLMSYSLKVRIAISDFKETKDKKYLIFSHLDIDNINMEDSDQVCEFFNTRKGGDGRRWPLFFDIYMFQKRSIVVLLCLQNGVDNGRSL